MKTVAVFLFAILGLVFLIAAAAVARGMASWLLARLISMLSGA